MAPRPAAVIGLRDAQTGTARATRVRQLATPSWLSTRPKPVIRRLAAARSRCSREPRQQLGARYGAPEVLGFSLALRAGAAMAQHDFAATR